MARPDRGFPVRPSARLPARAWPPGEGTRPGGSQRRDLPPPPPSAPDTPTPRPSPTGQRYRRRPPRTGPLRRTSSGLRPVGCPPPVPLCNWATPWTWGLSCHSKSILIANSNCERTGSVAARSSCSNASNSPRIVPLSWSGESACGMADCPPGADSWPTTATVSVCAAETATGITAVVSFTAATISAVRMGYTLVEWVWSDALHAWSQPARWRITKR